MYRKFICSVSFILLLVLLCEVSGAQVSVAENLLVDLRAEDLPYGQGVTTWPNHGSLGDFMASGLPLVEDIAGMNQVSINRDWYTPDVGRYARPAYYDHDTGVWLDMENRTPLTQTELNRLRHYKMKIEYDERIQDPRYQPPGLPRGPGTIFNGIRYWEEVLPVIS